MSAVVNGNQLEVLKAMLDPASTTTILGPASEVEVLDSSTSRHVLRIRIAAAGPVGQVRRAALGAQEVWKRAKTIHRLFGQERG